MNKEEPAERSPHSYLSKEEFSRLRDFARDKETPFLAVDLRKIGVRYDELSRAVPNGKIYYAVKANPMNEVLALLYARGSNFDVASVHEIDQLLRLGVQAERMGYGNTIKKERDIAYAFEAGIRLFTTDSESDVEKLAKHAPGSRVMFRLLFDGSGAADWPLSRKFGAHPDLVYKLVLKARDLGLVPYGVSFHVGSQQRDVGQWDSAIALCKYLFDSLKQEGVKLRVINLGGGLPAHYLHPTPETKVYLKSIRRYLREDFPKQDIDIILEPGRSIVGDAGVIVSEVALVSRKSDTQDTRWVYLDVGKFGGLIETIDESIKYPILTEHKTGDEDASEVILAGPTCDSYDILYENHKYRLPNVLKEGERVYICSTGAYTMSYSSVNFNGFPPLRAYILPPSEKHGKTKKNKDVGRTLKTKVLARR